jgi:hypothetical protein
MVNPEALTFQNWDTDKPVDWEFLKLEDMHYEMWEDIYSSYQERN